MIFIHYISLYLQYTDIYGCKYNKKKWDGQTFKSFFLTFCIFHENDVRSRLQMTQIHPFFILAHKCFFLKKVSKYHCLQINYWYITICKITLPNMFTKKYHQITIKHCTKTQNCSQLHIEKIRIRLLKIVPKSHPTKWALDAHSTGNKCPSLVLSMPITWSLSARVTGTQRPANVLIPNFSCLSSILFLVNINILYKLKR